MNVKVVVGSAFKNEMDKLLFVKLFFFNFYFCVWRVKCVRSAGFKITAVFNDDHEKLY